MKNLNITTENFSVIRETLKSGESANVNGVITLVGYKANTEKVNANGKKTRTAFMYIAEDGKRYTSTTLKAVLGIEAETKGERKETTFATLWEQISKMFATATDVEIKEALKAFQAEEKRRNEKKQKEKAELEKKEKAELARLLKKYGK